MSLRVVLLVEDDEAHAQLALRALERMPALRVDVVESLAQARQALRSTVDLVLADLHLPDGSGLELLSQDTPVVVQTSQGDEARAVAAMKGGALDYCVKSPEMYRDLPIIIERALNASRNLIERRKAERSLHESDERFRQLAASIPEAFWLLDLGSREVVYSSPAWESVYGDVPRSWEGRLQHVSDADTTAMLDVAPTDGTVLCLRQGGRERFVEERRFWIRDAMGRPYRLSCLATDITRRRQLEASLLHAQKMQAIGQLAGGVAHDFNNMLAAILSGAHELMEGGADRELCEMIVSASTRASELTRNLLSFSRRGQVDRRPVDVHSVIREALTLLGRSMDRAVVIETGLRSRRTEVIGDAAQLQSAILNLGINARDALEQGGVIRVTTREVELDDAMCRDLPFELQPGLHLELKVSDTGVGIPADVLPHIFEPFFTTKAVDRGTGLGLAAVYGTVLEHRGAIAVRSQPGEGTTFTLLLPLTAERRPPSPSRQSGAGGRGQVLLVDDEPLMLRAGRHMLERLGYSVVTAPDGEEAWDIFKAQAAAFVAIVTDLSMPRLDGRGLVRRVKELAPGFPCVMCTGYAGNLGDFDGPLLHKPFTRDDLSTALATEIGRAAQGA